MSSLRRCIALAALLLAPCAHGLVVRHDVDEWTFIRLASRYPATQRDSQWCSPLIPRDRSSI